MINDKNDQFAVPGFLANGVSAGIKNDGRKDLALIYAEKPARAAGIFTTNAFKAAPVLLGRERLASGYIQAIVINSGNANAATGREGFAHAMAMSRAVSSRLKIADELVTVASTGVIGVPLPIAKIEASADALVQGLRPQGMLCAEEAIMTTDRFPKMAWEKLFVADKEITICGIAKGAGMIEPHMATLLAFVMTDADIEPVTLKNIFREVADGTFNAISVDGCMSTNDTAIIMANGWAKNPTITKDGRHFQTFKEKLYSVMLKLAQDIVRDGEGATKIIEITITGARTREEARKAAYAIANSNLVKTAFFGGDPNWGRIISALGAAGVHLSVEEVSVSLDGITIFEQGQGVLKNEELIVEVMQREHILVEVELAMGEQGFTVFSSDLTYDYVKINAHYRT